MSKTEIKPNNILQFDLRAGGKPKPKKNPNSGHEKTGKIEEYPRRLKKESLRKRIVDLFKKQGTPDDAMVLEEDDDSIRLSVGVADETDIEYELQIAFTKDTDDVFFFVGRIVENEPIKIDIYKKVNELNLKYDFVTYAFQEGALLSKTYWTLAEDGEMDEEEEAEDIYITGIDLLFISMEAFDCVV